MYVVFELNMQPKEKRITARWKSRKKNVSHHSIYASSSTCRCPIHVTITLHYYSLTSAALLTQIMNFYGSW